jgi:hypothetical protein
MGNLVDFRAAFWLGLLGLEGYRCKGGKRYTSGVHDAWK